MSKELEGAVARLERALQQGLNIDLHEYDDPDQAKAHAKELEAEEKLGEKANAAAAKELEEATA